MTPGARGGGAVLAALALHGAALAAVGSLVPASGAGALFWVDMQGASTEAAGRGEADGIDDQALGDMLDDEGDSFFDSGAVEAVALVLIETPPPELGPAPKPVRSAAEEAALGRTHPSPLSAVDMAGSRAAARGGVAEPGTRAWTGRDDREDKRAQLWSDARRYQLPRQRTDRTRRSDESIARAPRLAFQDRHRLRRRVARTGQRDPAPPRAKGEDAGAAAVSDTGSTSPDALRASDPQPTRAFGVLVPAEASPLVALGPPATEARRDGAVRDNTASIASSDETDPAPFDLTRPAAGGDRRRPGVLGRARDSGAGGRARRSPGSAALRASVERGAPDLAVQAWRTDPYFRSMYVRLDALVSYPRALALSLEQGEVVVRFTLYANGRVSGVQVEKSSGYKQFDEQVTTAVARAAPFGRVPAAILGERRAISVRAPYAFRNPWIR